MPIVKITATPGRFITDFLILNKVIKCPEEKVKEKHFGENAMTANICLM